MCIYCFLFSRKLFRKYGGHTVFILRDSHGLLLDCEARLPEFAGIQKWRCAFGVGNFDHCTSLNHWGGYPLLGKGHGEDWVQSAPPPPISMEKLRAWQNQEDTPTWLAQCCGYECLDGAWKPSWSISSLATILCPLLAAFHSLRPTIQVLSLDVGAFL